MHDPTRAALAAIALGLGVLWAGPPVLAQAADDVSAPAAETSPVDTPSPNAAEADDGVAATAAEAPPVETSAEDAALAADGVSVPAAEIRAVESSDDTAQAADAAADDPPPIERPTAIAAQMANWITTSGDNGGRPFVIVDKVAADVFAFDAEGQLQGATAALVGLAPGDDSAEGIGDRNLSAIPPDERTTPAGRFLAGFGAAYGHRKVLWVDYATAISLHPVVTTNPKERRLERLRSPAPEDRRITYGCINVPAAFYRDVVLKAFADGGGVVYILPDTRPLAEVFPAFAALTRASLAPNEAPGDQGSQGVSDIAAAAPSPDDANEHASESSDREPALSPDLVNTAGADVRPW